MTQVERNARRVEQPELSVEKSAVALDDETQLVTLELETAAETPVRVTVTDPVRDPHAVKLDDGTTYSDGVLTIERTVDPGAVTRIDYPIVGPTATGLPTSSIERVTRADGGEDITIEWLGEDGRIGDELVPCEFLAAVTGERPVEG